MSLMEMLTPKNKRGDHILCVFYDEKNEKESVWLPIVRGAVTYGQYRYRMSIKHIIRDAKKKTPEIHFIKGNGIPLTKNGNPVKGTDNGTDVHSKDPRDQTNGFIDAESDKEKMEAWVVKQAFDAFAGGMFEDKRFMLLFVIMIAGFSILYYNFDKLSKVVEKGLGG